MRVIISLPIPVAARSKACVCGRLLPGVAGSIPPFVSCECCALSGRFRCDGPIICPEEPYLTGVVCPRMIEVPHGGGIVLLGLSSLERKKNTFLATPIFI